MKEGGVPWASVRGTSNMAAFVALTASLALNLAWMEQYYGSGALFPMLGLNQELPLELAFNGEEMDAIDLVFEFPGEEECGSWVSNYTNLHKKILKGELPQKFITFMPPPSNKIGDSLMGLASVFLAALFTDRAILIADPRLTSAFDPANVNWKVKGGIPLDATAGGPGNSALPSDAIPGAVLYLELMNQNQTKDGMVTFPDNIPEFFSQFDGAANLLVATNGGVLTKIFGSNSRTFQKMFYDWGFRVPTAYGCMLRYLMRPHRDIVDSIRPQLQLMQKEWTKSVCLGMQPDAPSDQNLDPNSIATSTQSLLQIVANIEEYWFPPSWKIYYLFSSDSAVARDKAVSLYPKKVWLLKNASSLGENLPGSQELKDAVAEWLLFSSCNYYVFTDSTFVKSSFGYNIWMPLVFHYAPLSEAITVPPPEDASHGHSILSLKEWNGL